MILYGVNSCPFLPLFNIKGPPQINQDSPSFGIDNKQLLYIMDDYILIHQYG